MESIFIISLSTWACNFALICSWSSGLVLSGTPSLFYHWRQSSVLANENVSLSWIIDSNKKRILYERYFTAGCWFTYCTFSTCNGGALLAVIRPLCVLNCRMMHVFNIDMNHIMIAGPWRCMVHGGGRCTRCTGRRQGRGGTYLLITMFWTYRFIGNLSTAIILLSTDQYHTLTLYSLDNIRNHTSRVVLFVI